MARTGRAAAIGSSVRACACILGILAGCHTSSRATRVSDASASRARPNVIVVFTDDQGYGDVGYQGARGFSTPNIDRMAAEGMQFTDFYVAASACTPSRAALLTGCYPQRVGLPAVLFPWDRVGLHDDELTIAEILKAEGYATAAVGKWHLGHAPKFLPPAHGFDEWFGLPYSNDMAPGNGDRYPPLPLMRGAEVIETDPDQATLTRRYTDEALSFIRRQKDKPFFLYLAHTFPHVPLFASDRFRGKTRRGIYGDVIEEIDWSVGQVLAELDRQKLTNNTLVIFTSDNGPWLIQGVNGGSAAPLREGKATSFEGGHRVPCVMRWPAKIRAGQVCRTMVTSMDLLPTITALCGGTLPDRKIDGRDVSTLLLGNELSGAAEHPFFYYRRSQLQAVRVGRFKLHLPHDYSSVQGTPAAVRMETRTIGLSLFDLEADIGETNDVRAEHPAVMERLLELCSLARSDLGDTRDGKRIVGSGVRPPGQPR